jgi:hypothetical protein
MSEQLNLFQNANEQWKKAARSSKNRSYNFDTVSGEPVDLLYHPECNENDYLKNLGFPGQYPFTLHFFRGPMIKLYTMFLFSTFQSYFVWIGQVL